MWTGPGNDLSRRSDDLGSGTSGRVCGSCGAGDRGHHHF